MRARLLKGYPVVGLDDGSMLGKVQELTINREDKKIEGLLIGEKGLLKEKVQIIPYQQVYNIGKDVLIIKNKEDLPPEGKQQQGETYSFLGNSVISSEGDYLARIQDFTFSEKTGEIESLLLHDFKDREKIHKNTSLAIEGVLKLGKDYVITREDYSSYLQEEKREEEPGRFKMPIYSLEMRAIDFALGKEAAHTVKDANGDILVKKGEKITDEIIDGARAAGRLYQVLFAAGVGELLDSIDYTVEKLDRGSTHLLQAWENLKNRSRYIFKGAAGPGSTEEGAGVTAETAGENTEEAKQAVAEGDPAQKEDTENPETDERFSPTAEFIERVKGIWGRLEEELGNQGKELAQESHEKIKKFILGKKTNYAVNNNQGEQLIGPGEEITAETIEAAENQNKITAIFLAALTQEIENNLGVIGDKISGIFR